MSAIFLIIFIDVIGILLFLISEIEGNMLWRMPNVIFF